MCVGNLSVIETDFYFFESLLIPAIASEESG
jgi:hypothetical protein